MQEQPLPSDADVEVVVAERVTALLEARLRERDKLQTERSRRLVPLARSLAENEDESDIIAMLLDDYYQQMLHAPVPQPTNTLPVAQPRQPDPDSGRRRSPSPAVGRTKVNRSGLRRPDRFEYGNLVKAKSVRSPKTGPIIGVGSFSIWPTPLRSETLHVDDRDALIAVHVKTGVIGWIARLGLPGEGHGLNILCIHLAIAGCRRHVEVVTGHVQHRQGQGLVLVAGRISAAEDVLKLAGRQAAVHIAAGHRGGGDELAVGVRELAAVDRVAS